MVSKIRPVHHIFVWQSLRRDQSQSHVGQIFGIFQGWEEGGVHPVKFEKNLSKVGNGKGWSDPKSKIEEVWVEKMKDVEWY